MRTLSESDQRSGALFGIIVCMATLFVVCLLSSEMQSMICFCIACTAMLSMMNLASASNPDFGKRYRCLLYFFALAPAVYGSFHLFKERARINEEYSTLLFGLIPVAIFFVGYNWYLRSHGVDPTVEAEVVKHEVSKEAITKNCSEVHDRPS
ncbi:MAG: hypothetical protein MUC83_01660 [Pirellula sp.]|nr:hypothetical protein [Pirellula sp.]